DDVGALGLGAVAREPGPTPALVLGVVGRELLAPVLPDRAQAPVEQAGQNEIDENPPAHELQSDPRPEGSVLDVGERIARHIPGAVRRRANAGEWDPAAPRGDGLEPDPGALPRREHRVDVAEPVPEPEAKPPPGGPELAGDQRVVGRGEPPAAPVLD